MNWLDVVLVFVFTLIFYNGIGDTLMLQTAKLLSFLTAFYLSFLVLEFVDSLFQEHLNIQEFLSVLADFGPASLPALKSIVNMGIYLCLFAVILWSFGLAIQRLKVFQRNICIKFFDVFLASLAGFIRAALAVFFVAGILFLIRVDFLIRAAESSAVIALSRHYLSELFELIVNPLVDNLRWVI